MRDKPHIYAGNREGKVKNLKKITAAFLAALLIICLFVPSAMAAEIDEDEVSAVVAQLEAVDTLSEMQEKRKEFGVSAGYEDANENGASPEIIAEHEAARAGYEEYISKMFAARLAAKTAYEALSAEEKAMISEELVSKLDDELPTVFKPDASYPITPSDNEYTYELIFSNSKHPYHAYELSSHIVRSNDMPSTMVLVDVSGDATTWSPDGLYSYGESNYEVVYCCDAVMMPKNKAHYKRVNLEDSDYYGKEAASKIRAIVRNSYPYVSIDEMKVFLRENGLDGNLVDSLTRSDIIAGVQQAIWTFANNTEDKIFDLVTYGGTLDMGNNNLIHVMHDYSNEIWDWYWMGKSYRNWTYDAKAAYRVNSLVYFLCRLDGVEADEDSVIISDIDITRADLIEGTDDTYKVGFYVHLNSGGGEKDRLEITAVSTDAQGNVTGRSIRDVYASDKYEMEIEARYGDTITVTVQGTQYVERNVYFYRHEGERDASQALVGVGEGETRVKAQESFTFEKDISMGLRIYKSAEGTTLPISDITFNAYIVNDTEGIVIGEDPDKSTVNSIAVEENLAASMVTDSTGYASADLDEGVYLIVEEHNKAKVVSPVDPFFIQIPWPVEAETVTGEDTEIQIEYQNIVSIYPKNTPTDPPEDPPELPPPPDNVKGKFRIVKHDSSDRSKVLSGAEFTVFRPATESDENPLVLSCGGVEYSVVPVYVGEEKLILKTDESGEAISPEITCGTYFILETKAPEGYRVPGEAVSINVISSAVASPEVYYISNVAGVLLPETGSTGTGTFIFIGSLIAGVAAILLITKKRMSVYEEE